MKVFEGEKTNPTKTQKLLLIPNRTATKNLKKGEQQDKQDAIENSARKS